MIDAAIGVALMSKNRTDFGRINYAYIVLVSKLDGVVWV